MAHVLGSGRDLDPDVYPLTSPLLPRKEGITYTADSHGDYFYILTNEASINNSLYRVLKQDLTVREIVIEHREYVLIEEFQVRQHHIVVIERSNAKQMVRVITHDSFYYLDIAAVSGEHAGVYTLWLGSIDEEVADLTKKELWATDIFR